VKLVFAIAIPVTMVFALAASCSITHKSGEFACSTTADCNTGRDCVDGFCVVSGTEMIDAPAVVKDAPKVFNDGPAMTCPTACTSCNTATHTCLIDCSVTPGKCDGSAGVACPAGWNCDAKCNTQGSCSHGVACGEATTCTIECTAKNTCPNVKCGTNRCDVTCSGAASCAQDVDCTDSCACDVKCTLAVQACPGADNPMCQGNGECDTPTGCSSTQAATCNSCP
jgi:hypothetical protein